MKMVKCLPEFEYFYCILKKIENLFLKLEDQKLQTMQLKHASSSPFKNSIYNSIKMNLTLFFLNTAWNMYFVKQ